MKHKAALAVIGIIFLFLASSACKACKPVYKETVFISHDTRDKGKILPTDTLLIFVNPRGEEMKYQALLNKNMEVIPVKAFNPKFGCKIENINDYAFYKPEQHLNKNELYAFFSTGGDEQAILERLAAIGKKPDFYSREYFSTGTEKAQIPTEHFRPLKHRQTYTNKGMCGTDETHTFTPERKMQYSLYLVKISHGKKSRYYLKRANNGRILFRQWTYFGPMYDDLPFMQGRRYKIWIAPVSTAGLVGEFSGECSIYSKRPPVMIVLAHRLGGTTMVYIHGIVLLFVAIVFFAVIFIIRRIIRRRREARKYLANTNHYGSN